MKTVLIRGTAAPPRELREIVEGGSTELAEVMGRDEIRARDADRVVEWNGRALRVGDRWLQWPEDEDELKMLFQTGG
jgi:hypothetical protein